MHSSIFLFLHVSLKVLVDGYRQWSSSVPNLGKVQRTAAALPGFTSLMEMGKVACYIHLYSAVFKILKSALIL